MTVYQPREDSYLMQETLINYLKNLRKSIENFEKIGATKFSKKNFAQISFGNHNYAKFSISILDMGSGSGILILKCKELGFNRLTAVDIDEETVNYLNKLKIKAIRSDLFSNIKGKFDLIIFNPPYLPEDKREPKDSRIHTTAGKKGYELIINFLEQAKNYLKDSGKILLLFSSLSKPKIIKNKARELGYKTKLLNKKKLFFEELFVYEIMMK